jgi:hypothetical protein
VKKSRYKEEQIVSILREAKSGTVTATARKIGPLLGTARFLVSNWGNSAIEAAKYSMLM